MNTESTSDPPHAAASVHQPCALPPRDAPRAELTLRELMHELPAATLVDQAAASVGVRGVHHDSRRVEPGDLFVARPGAKAEGATFIADARARGAAAVIVPRGSSAMTHGLPRIEAADVSAALAFAAAAVYGHPTFALEVVGITGTNGKTTTAHLAQAAIDAAGGRAGIVGTLGYRFADVDLPAPHTSPEADELARIAAAMRTRGATHLVMEVSSIALAARRVEAVRFRVAAFTNLTQDHLDYHGTMEAYAAAKARLFVDLAPGAAAINIDDPFGAELAARLGAEGPPRVPLCRFSARPEADANHTEIAPLALEHTRAGISLEARTPRGNVWIRSPLYGAHNVENLLTALSIAHLLDLDLRVVAEALSTPITVAGRLERCDTPGVDDVVVLVDYAHTPDALARVLTSVRKMGEGRLVCVFGCGGDRDAKKRPRMGEAVARLADVAFVTSDNPRSEDPRAIVDAILPGMTSAPPGSIHVELDRRRAIREAVLGAAPGDRIVLAGKGHEPYQIVGATTLCFDDREEARAALRLRREARSLEGAS
jgi:UDP-N-acetylmuramoyl-L-alanyl-D-glutamate--2,6-diaminopimelate ligase